MESPFSNLPLSPTLPLKFSDLVKISEFLKQSEEDQHSEQMKSNSVVYYFDGKQVEEMSYRRAFAKHGPMYGIETDPKTLAELIVKTRQNQS